MPGARKLGHPRFVKPMRLSEHQLTKLETAKTAPLPELSALHLAVALQAPMQALTGEQPFIEDNFKPKSTCPSGYCG